MFTKNLLRPFQQLGLLKAFSRCSSTKSTRVTKSQRLLGVYTKYAWVLVKQAYVSRHWTAQEIEHEVESRLGNRASEADKFEIQKIADLWQQNVTISQIPKTRKVTNDHLKKSAEMQLFREQLKEESATGKSRGKRTDSSELSEEVSAVQAWNYFMAMKYPEYKHLLKKEARAKVGLLWRNMYPEEKEKYQEEYRQLKAQGKDILLGKIVDAATKLKANERIKRAKTAAHLKKQKQLELQMETYQQE